MLKNFLSSIRRFFTNEKLIAIKTPIFEGDMLRGRTALIIGGSGGIGCAIAEAFVNNGCSVVISGTDEKKLTNVCKKIGKNINWVVLDLNNVESISKVVDNTSKMLDGHIDILVNSAGIHGPSEFWATTEKDYDDVMNINVKAMFFMCQAVGKHMREKSIKGHILNISSASALKLGKTPYEISKNAVRSMTLGIASELIKYGIVVNCVGPGPTATPMLNKNENSSLKWNGNPAGRLATPEEIANWAVFLTSNLGDYVVGDSLYVSGGSGTICIDK